MNMKSYVTSPWAYFVATYAWTWFFWGIAFVLGVSGETGGALGPSLILLGLAGPMVMGITFLYGTQSKQVQQDYWKRVVDLKRISAAWYGVIFLLMPLLTLIAGCWSGHWQTYTFGNMLSSLWLALLVSPLVPIFEELGWRGYILDRLQERYNALYSSLILGSFWALWHVPTFFLAGSVLTKVAIGSLPFWLYFFNIILVSIIFTWIYNNNGYSILSAILFHTVLEILSNFGMWSWFSDKVVYNTVVLFVTVVMIVSIWGSEKLVLKNK